MALRHMAIQELSPQGSFGASIGKGLGTGLGAGLSQAIPQMAKQQADVGQLRSLFKPEFAQLADVMAMFPRDKWQNFLGAVDQRALAQGEVPGQMPPPDQGQGGLQRLTDQGEQQQQPQMPSALELLQSQASGQQMPSALELLQSQASGQPLGQQAFMPQQQDLQQFPRQEQMVPPQMEQQAAQPQQPPMEKFPLISGTPESKQAELALKQQAAQDKRQAAIDKSNLKFVQGVDKTYASSRELDHLIDQYEQLLNTGDFSDPQTVKLFIDGKLAPSAVTEDTMALDSLAKEIASKLDLLSRGNPSEGRIKYAQSMKFDPGMPEKAQRKRMSDIRETNQRNYDLFKAKGSIIDENAGNQPPQLERKTFERFDERKKSPSVPSGAKAGQIVTVEGKSYLVEEE